MGASNFKELIQHAGHEIECVTYTDGNKEVFNVAIECKTCEEVLLDYDVAEEEQIREIHTEDGKIILIEPMQEEDNLYSIFITENEVTELYEDNLDRFEVEREIKRLMGIRQLMYGVEYEREDGETTTYEIFDNLPEAINFSKKVNWLYIFSSEMKNIFQETDGTWNYDDEHDTLYNTQIIYENKEFERKTQ